MRGVFSPVLASQGGTAWPLSWSGRPSGGRPCGGAKLGFAFMQGVFSPVLASQGWTARLLFWSGRPPGGGPGGGTKRGFAFVQVVFRHVPGACCCRRRLLVVSLTSRNPRRRCTFIAGDVWFCCGPEFFGQVGRALLGRGQGSGAAQLSFALGLSFIFMEARYWLIVDDDRLVAVGIPAAGRSYALGFAFRFRRRRFGTRITCQAK